jgi:type IV secretion system protein VirB11
MTDSQLNYRLLPFKPFLDDRSLTEIVVNQPYELFTESKDGWTRYDKPELSFAHLMSLAELIAGFNNDSIGDIKPILSASLPDGERVQIVTPNCTEKGFISFTIRKPSRDIYTLEQLEEQGRFNLVKKSERIVKPFEYELQNLLNDGKIVAALDLAMKTRRNVLLAGATGSGKTTVGITLGLSIPMSERVITIEDTREIKLTHPNKVHLLYDRNNKGVTAKEAVEATLRMKPNRIILAECRGDEALPFLFSLNTDHAGISTIHANGAEDALYQLASLVQGSEIGSRMPMDYILKRVFSSIDLVLYYQNLQLVEYYYEPEYKLNAFRKL